MRPGIQSLHEDRERTPRRRNSEASTEVPICPSPSEGEPIPPETHDPPDRPDDGSPAKKPRVDGSGEAMEESPEIDDDELLVEDVHFVEKSGHPQCNQLPEGWVVVNDRLELDEAWMANAVKGIRKGEINTRELSLAQREEVIAAKIKELKSFFTNQVWEFAGEKDNKDTDRVVTARWVLTWKKTDDDKYQAKARLVLRGFQDPDLFNLDKASPTAARLGKLTLLSLAAIEGWKISCGDVRAAFLILEWCKLCTKADGSSAKGLWAALGNPLHGGGDDADAQECLRTGRRPIALVPRGDKATEETQYGSPAFGSMHLWLL